VGLLGLRGEKEVGCLMFTSLSHGDTFVLVSLTHIPAPTRLPTGRHTNKDGERSKMKKLFICFSLIGKVL